jgi:hypothetical protein
MDLLLTILYWIILILSVIGIIAPPTDPKYVRLTGFTSLVLFVIIGLRVFALK